ncbi:MAG TPA: glycerophosphodiester phosphodiesterase [Gaiellaceae bacterium]|nr:glycerophosphodiester phosphodiesterase [Gaiellaceae bacterium]
MIALERRNGRPLRIGHRGAKALAPENTLESFHAAIEVGVDLVEFDVIAGTDGSLLVAHGLEDVGDQTPTLDEALRFFVDEAPTTGIHLDLKLTRRERDVVEAVRRLDLANRSFVSSYYFGTARAVASHDGEVRTGFTVPRRVFRISETGRSAPLARVGLRVLRWVTPRAVRPLLSATRATAVVLHHSLVSTASVRAAHRRGAAVVTWTVDDAAVLARVDAAGVDAVVSNDPRLFLPN